MTVPSRCHSQDCAGYLGCSLLTHAVCPGTIPQPSIGNGFGRSYRAFPTVIPFEVGHSHFKAFLQYGKLY